MNAKNVERNSIRCENSQWEFCYISFLTAFSTHTNAMRSSYFVRFLCLMINKQTKNNTKQILITFTYFVLRLKLLEEKKESKSVYIIVVVMCQQSSITI